MQTKLRRARIATLIKQHQVESQEELLRLLSNAGVEVTQSTLSRDLSELRIAKSNGSYQFIESPVVRWRQLGFRGIVQAGPHMLVVRTDTGAAQRIGVLIDEAELEGVAGTLAGDDTIFVALSDSSVQSAIQQQLEAGL